MLLAASIYQRGGPQMPPLQLKDAQSLSVEQGQPMTAFGGVHDADWAGVGAVIDMIAGRASAAGAYLRISLRRDTDRDLLAGSTKRKRSSCLTASQIRSASTTTFKELCRNCAA